MLNASVGVQRVLGRLRPVPRTRSAGATNLHRKSLGIARAAVDRMARLRAGTPHLAAPETLRVAPTLAALRLRRARRRFGPEAVLPLAVAAIVLAGSGLSLLPDALPAGPVGGPDGAGGAPRLVVGGHGGVLAEGYDAERAIDPGRFRAIDPRAFGAGEEVAAAAPTEPPIEGPFLADGTLVKPVAVDTSIVDGKGLLRTHQVRPGETLVGIANHYKVSMMTVWWANRLTSKDSLVVGQALTIPPVDGLVVTVKAGDTLDSIAATHRVDANRIYETNALNDRVLLIGQTLVIPGAEGAPIPTPTPKPVTKPRNTGGGSVSGPATYTGGAFVWPVVGGGNYISQYYRYGHYGIDIAADYGSKVRASAGGTVVFAGWKNNGGGYQVHLSHGSGLYTTYNHMSSVTVGRGQSVARGQQVGRIGQSGFATGPHLHFEVWKGGIWNGGSRVNPLAYL